MDFRIEFVWYDVVFVLHIFWIILDDLILFVWKLYSALCI